MSGWTGVGAAALLATAALAGPASSTTYYVATSGSDTRDGRSPVAAWRTIDRVNRADLKPGDRVLFRRGDMWRGSLRPHSGAAGRPITYSAFGRGAKPEFRGSVAASRPADWRRAGNDLWVCGGTPSQEHRGLAEPDPGERARQWWHYAENGAAANGVPRRSAASPAGYTITCLKPGSLRSDLQVMAQGIGLEAGKCYRLLLRMRADRAITVAMPSLMRASSPWTDFSSGPGLRSAAVGTEWSVACQYYRANTTSRDARLTLYLGDALPQGARLEIDRCSFLECPATELPVDGPFPVDVGNLIFGNEASCGVKVWTQADLKHQGQFWYDPQERTVTLYSTTNPAARYGKIECALYRHIIDEGGASHVTYEDLALRYGGAHGIGGGDTHHITVRRCDLSYIGGADQFGGGKRVRFGNGIEFWANAHDNLVEWCRLWEIYDAALTNQNMGNPSTEADITYRYNTIWNSEYSFEYWNRPGTSKTARIAFIHNTCLNAGHGWSHAQRPDPSGRHLCFYASEAAESEILVANNLFIEATGNAFYAPDWTASAISRLKLDGNLWRQASGNMMSVAGRNYPMSAFAAYQAATGQDSHSRVAGQVPNGTGLAIDLRDLAAAAPNPPLRDPGCPKQPHRP